MRKTRKHPCDYDVKYINHIFFKDFGSLDVLKSIRPGQRVGDPTVNNLRCIRYNPDGTVIFKLSHSDAEWSPLPMPRSCCQSSVQPVTTMPTLFTAPLQIKQQKWKHLQELKRVIPADYHSFYDNLAHE